jgi:hypothetical protein
MSNSGGFADEWELFPDLPPEPGALPGHADVIRQALRRAADEAYPDDNAAPYQETLRALAAGEITVTSVDARTDIPPAAYTALGVAMQAYEPEATALIIRSPAALLQVLLEAGRRAVVAAAPAIREAPPPSLGEGFLP